MENRKALTAAQIRYLLTMKQLDGDGNGVRGAKVAAVLGFTSPSVPHHAQHLREMNLIRKDAYGVAYFTENGRDVVARYSRYYQAAFNLLSAHFPPDETPADRCLRAARRASGSKPRAVPAPAVPAPQGCVRRLPAASHLTGPRTTQQKGKRIMTQITIKIDGMMCGMCESHVNDAVRRAFPVKKVTLLAREGPDRHPD